MAGVTFAGLDTAGLVPKPLAAEILKKVQEQSVVQRLSGQTPIPLQGASIAVQTKGVEAGVVGEGEAKPVDAPEYAVKSIKPIKVAAITVISKEVRLANPLNVLENISENLTDAITRAFDLAVLHGKSAKTGLDIAGVEAVADTAQSVELGTAATTAGGLSADLIAGYNLVTNNYDFGSFSGFAADPRFRGQLLGAVDAQGRPIYQQTINLRDGMDNVLGLPVAYGKSTSGQVGASADTNVRAIGGDWGALKYGFAEQLTLSRSDQATIVDGATTYNLWQQNMEAYLVEAIFGWVITDPKAFVKYTETTTP